MNIITKKVAVAIFGLMLLAIPAAPAFATDMGIDYYDTGWSDTGYFDSYDASYDTSYDTGWSDTGYFDSYDASYDTSYNTSWEDTGYYDTYSPSYDSYSGGYSSGYSSGSSFSMPSFANQQYRASYPTFPSYPQQPSKPSNTTVTTNTCVNDSCNYVDNSIVDNSIKVSNSFNNQKEKKQKKEEYRYDDCYGYEYGYNQGYGYNDYNYGYNDCYVAPPIAYNPTPYITLSQTPYTGLDLGPMGEVLYWTFLVLWCLGAAYLIVVKRVQNKLVGFLNGFLFGSTATKASAHTTHTPVAHTAVAARAPMVEEGIDPFIQSQIKRS